MIETGEIAPDFTLPGTGGSEVNLTRLQGAPVVLYFYPRDDTSGCTREAVEFSGLLPEFDAAGARVFGISRDSLRKHEKFAEKHALIVPLLSDEDGHVCERSGVWTDKSMYGKTHMGIERTTFLIDPEGRVARVWRKVKVPGHAEEVLEAVKGL